MEEGERERRREERGEGGERGGRRDGRREGREGRRERGEGERREERGEGGERGGRREGREEFKYVEEVGTIYGSYCREEFGAEGSGKPSEASHAKTEMSPHKALGDRTSCHTEAMSYMYVPFTPTGTSWKASCLPALGFHFSKTSTQHRQLPQVMCTAEAR